ncbi:hypothetical protein [Nocardiopsis ganjiahuensis]|nr:hypothetical protein [Nocardiopsis ganjiahuensis]
MNDTSQIDDQTDLGPFSPGDEERFKTNALLALVAFVTVTVVAVVAFFSM